MLRLAFVSVALLLVVAGCVGTPAGPETGTDAPTASPTDEPPATERERSPTEGVDLRTTNCSDAIKWVSFYNLGNAGEYDLWTKRHASVGYTLHGNASVFLVAYSDGERLGADHVSTVQYDHGITADGDAVRFDEPLDGSRSIRVVAHRDVDRDGRFDPETDLACEDDDGLVSTDVAIVDFGDLTTETPGTPTGA